MERTIFSLSCMALFPNVTTCNGVPFCETNTKSMLRNVTRKH